MKITVDNDLGEQEPKISLQSNGERVEGGSNTDVRCVRNGVHQLPHSRSQPS